MAALVLIIPIALVVGLFVTFSFIGWIEVDEPGLVSGMTPARKRQPSARVAAHPPITASDFAQPVSR